MGRRHEYVHMHTTDSITKKSPAIKRREINAENVDFHDEPPHV
jgi:hypothetical protein